MAPRKPKSQSRTPKSESGKVLGSTDPRELTVKVALEADDSLEPIYSNFAEVAQGQYECEINFSRVPAKLSQERLDAIQDGGVLKIYPIIKVIIPKALVPGLVRALSAHAEKENSGETSDDNSAAAT